MLSPAILALSLLGQAPTTPPDHKLLAMGREKWAEDYGDQNGWSTMAMCDAQTLWGEAAQRRNDNLLRKRPEQDRKDFGALRKPLLEFQFEMTYVRRCFTGGGTMWNPVFAGALGDREDLIYSILNGQGKAKKAMVVSDVTKGFDLAAKDIEANEFMDSFSEDLGKATAKLHLAEARKQFDLVVEVLKRRPRRESDLVLEFAARELDLSDLKEP